MLTEAYKALFSVRDLSRLDEEHALDHIARLTDLSYDVCEEEGLRLAIRHAQDLQRRNLTPLHAATLEYFVANAWSNIRHLRMLVDQAPLWKTDDAEKEILHLRRARQNSGFSELDRARRCQILTNLANILNHLGRFIEAIELWDEALAIEPRFAMAHGNKGVCLGHYARILYDRGHAVQLLVSAARSLKTALSFPKQLYDDAQSAFHNCLENIEAVLPKIGSYAGDDPEPISFGESDSESRYRQWCLGNRLFLNPLNDLGQFPIAAVDVLTTPSIVVPAREGPCYPGCFNQLKQEFIAARYLFYESKTSKQSHFADRHVLLFDTLDYPEYSLAVEKARISFRMAYSLFDKIAFFLNDYLGLQIPEKKISFRTMWFRSQKKQKGLEPTIEKQINWPLRGLYWLSKDLYEEQPDFQESLEPDAKDLREIRNHLEHKYLKVCSVVVSPTEALADRMAYPVSRHEFNAKTLRLLRLARAALVYLALAIHREETVREKNRGNAKVAPMPLFPVEDDLKK